MCSSPYRQGVAEFGCGKCEPCLLNRKRLWTSRLMLEYTKHEAGYFVTLTYRKEDLPCDGSVSVRHAQEFLRKLRREVYPLKVRYYIVGEYGSQLLRPHYHVAVFGAKGMEKAMELSWPYGFVHVGSLTAQSAAYVVSYVVKHLTSRKDVRLKGRSPEFARMSLKPGIGAGMPVEVIANASMSKGGANYMASNLDVPGMVRSEKRMWPLGRYLKSKLREALGMDKGEPPASAERRGRELQAELREPGARGEREWKRVQAQRNIARRMEVQRSKKGNVL